MEPVQNFANHRRYIPIFHFAIFFVLIANALWSLWQAIKAPAVSTVIAALVALALFRLYLYVRTFATGNQDRIIRLETQLRLERILPADLRPRIPEFTVGQLIALRFASDAELPDLARRVLNEKQQDGKVIKGMIRNWQADLLRV